MCWADRVALIIVIICASIALMANLARGEDWVDARSSYHFGASVAIGAGVDSLLALKTDYTPTERAAMSFGLCMVPGILKEVAIDQRASTPDVVWDMAGCIAGVSLVEGSVVYLSNNGIYIRGAWE